MIQLLLDLLFKTPIPMAKTRFSIRAGSKFWGAPIGCDYRDLSKHVQLGVTHLCTRYCILDPYVEER